MQITNDKFNQTFLSSIIITLKKLCQKHKK